MNEQPDSAVVEMLVELACRAPSVQQSAVAVGVFRSRARSVHRSEPAAGRHRPHRASDGDQLWRRARPPSSGRRSLSLVYRYRPVALGGQVGSPRARAFRPRCASSVPRIRPVDCDQSPPLGSPDVRPGRRRSNPDSVRASGVCALRHGNHRPVESGQDDAGEGIRTQCGSAKVRCDVSGGDQVVGGPLDEVRRHTARSADQPRASVESADQPAVSRTARSRQNSRTRARHRRVHCGSAQYCIGRTHRLVAVRTSSVVDPPRGDSRRIGDVPVDAHDRTVRQPSCGRIPRAAGRSTASSHSDRRSHDRLSPPDPATSSVVGAVDRRRQFHTSASRSSALNHPAAGTSWRRTAPPAVVVRVGSAYGTTRSGPRAERTKR